MSACPREEDLIDLAYGEAGEGVRDELEEHVGGCERCGAKLADLRGTRAFFSQLGDAEPPARVRASLLAEAARAQHVTERRAGAGGPTGAPPIRGGRLKSTLQPLMSHPALAAAATIVVILGVAGALHLQGGSVAVENVAEPTAPGVGDDAEDDGAEDYGAVDEPRAAEAEAAPTERSAGDEEVSAEADGEADREELAAEGGPAGAAAGAVPPEEADDSVALVDPDPAPGSEARRRERQQQAPEQPSFDLGGIEESGGHVDGSDAIGDWDVDAPEGEPAEPAPRDVQPDRAEREPSAAGARGGARRSARSVDDDRDAAEAEEPSGDREARDAWIARTRERLIEAARAERCGDAASLAGELSEREPAYYREHLEGASVLEPCEDAIQRERARRAREAQ